MVSLCNSPSCPGTLCRPGWPQTHRDPPVSASQVLRLKACTTTAWTCYVFILSFTCQGVLPAYMAVYHMHAVPTEVRRRSQMPWNQSYRWLRSTMWMLGSKCGSSGRARSTPNHRAIFPIPILFLRNNLLCALQTSLENK